MKPDYDSLINAGLSKEEIAKISGCEDQEMQIRMLRKYRYKLLDIPIRHWRFTMLALPFFAVLEKPV